MALILLSTLFLFVSAAPVLRSPSCPVRLPTHATPRIVGGDEASPHTRSHIVSFYEEGCGGSLLSERWVLTAAHCLVHERSVARIDGSNSSNGVAIPVKRVFNHPDYKFPQDDVSLVELESPAPSSASFMALNSNPSVPEDNEFARVAGYGFLGEGFDDDHDALLRQVDVPVMNTTKCLERYFSVHSYLRNDISVRKHICAGYDAGGCDSCTADSGGPLFVYDEQNNPVQIALVSFGYGCAREVPGGYTRISTYVSWMKSVGAVFQEKTTRKAVFGETVSDASGPEPEEKEPAEGTEVESDEETEPGNEVGGEQEEEEEPINENSSEPAPDHVSSPIPESGTNAGSAAPSVPLGSSGPTDAPGQPNADETRPGPGPQPSANPTPRPSPRPSSIASSQPPSKSSPEPSPPGLLPSNDAVNAPSVGGPAASSNDQGGQGGEGLLKPSGNESSASKGSEDNGGESGGATGREDGAADVEVDSEDIEGDNAETGGDVKENEVDVATTAGEDNEDEEGTDQSPQTVAATDESAQTVSGSDESTQPVAAPLPNNKGNEHSMAVNNSKGDVVSAGPSDDGDTNEVTVGSGSGDDGGSSAGAFIGAVVAPGQSPAPSVQTGGEYLEDVESLEEGEFSEELEASSSPEISEAPEDANAANSEPGGGSSRLGGLQISMIVVGSVLAILCVGYVTYFVIQKVM